MTDIPERALTDPVQKAAQSLFTLAYPPVRRTHDSPPEPDRSAERAAMESSLRDKITRMLQDDTSDLEAILASQAQMLHHVFTHAVEKYAASPMADASRLHSNIALKSQHYCRMTIGALNQLKSGEASREKHKKTRNQLLRGEENAKVDARRTAETCGENPPVATLEESGH